MPLLIHFYPVLQLSEQKLEKGDDGMNIDREVCLYCNVHALAVGTLCAYLLLQILGLRFPKDLRVNEVRRLLSSSKPVRIALTQKPEIR